MDSVDEILETVDGSLKTVFANEHASTIITIFLVLYGGLAAPKLPNFIVNLFDNPVFRIIVLSLIVYKGNNDPKFAIMVAVAFTITLNIASKQRFLEGFANFTCDSGYSYSDINHNCECTSGIVDKNEQCCTGDEVLGDDKLCTAAPAADEDVTSEYDDEIDDEIDYDEIDYDEMDADDMAPESFADVDGKGCKFGQMADDGTCCNDDEEVNESGLCEPIEN